MTVQISDVAWGRYKSYEGPLFHGKVKYKFPNNPTDNDRLLCVTTATEGGALDAVQSYDSGIISVGLIQLIEAKYFLVSKLLGHIASHDPQLLNALQPALKASKATFKSNGRRWRFFFNDGNEVDELPEQQRLFLLNSTGHLGSWDNESKIHAKLWTATMANFLAQGPAIPLQTAYVASRLMTFVMPDAKKLLWDEKPSTGWVGALRAGYVSFSANNPLIASQGLQQAVKATNAAKWSPDWCITILKQLTFGPNITIYPGRYNKIRPVIEKNFGVDLPDFADDLKKWQAAQNQGTDPPSSKEPTFQTVEEIQTFLISMGYDLGPAGADGKLGGKTKEAIMTFQGLNGLLADGIVGPKTRAKMLEVYRKKICA